MTGPQPAGPATGLESGADVEIDVVALWSDPVARAQVPKPDVDRLPPHPAGAVLLADILS